MLSLFDADLSATFAASAVVIVDAQRLPLQIELDVSTATRVELILETTGGEAGAEPSAWPSFSETTAIANGNGLETDTRTRVIPSSSGTLPPGRHRLALDLSPCRAPLARVQLRAATGAVRAP